MMGFQALDSVLQSDYKDQQSLPSFLFILMNLVQLFITEVVQS